MQTASHSNRQLEYEEHGFFTVERLFTPSDLKELSQRTTDIAEGRVKDFPSSLIELEPNAEIQNAKTVRKINDCARNDSVFARYAANEKILDIVQEVLGPDIKLFGSQCFMKPPGGVEKPYHQDSPYFSIAPMALVTCWVALDEATLENGCLWVVPGSHRQGPLEHSEAWDLGNRIDMRIPESAFDRSKEVAITMPEGSCSFHHSLLLHMSHPNKTSQPRRGAAFHYMSSRSHWTNPETPAPEYPLLRGQAYPGCV